MWERNLQDLKVLYGFSPPEIPIIIQIYMIIGKFMLHIEQEKIRRLQK